jgi:hypothetical protein
LFQKKREKKEKQERKKKKEKQKENCVQHTKKGFGQQQVFGWCKLVIIYPLTTSHSFLCASFPLYSAT